MKSQNDSKALSLVIEHFLAKNATFHNHSFNNYFIDELIKCLPSIDWNCFTPKAVKKYQGVMYRGTSQPPAKIFADGFGELDSSAFISDYIKFRNNSTGISTSKDFDCALERVRWSNPQKCLI